MNAAPLIDATRLTVRFDRQTVLRDLSLGVARGETVAVIGESGCGKTVLLKTLIGLIRPNAGRVVFDGQPLAGLGERSMARLRTRFGFVWQNAALFDSMSVADNVAFPLVEHRRLARAEAYHQVVQRLAEVGLPPAVMTKKPAQLSGGMRKRVGLARALAIEPEVLLYDEPTTGLDPIVSDVINELMIEVRRKRPVTSVVVTHDMKTARKVADRVVMLYPLSRLAEGESQVLYNGPAAGIDDAADPRVRQFVRGEAGERLHEMKGGA